MKIIKEDEFNKLTNENKPVLVDFFASWCGPCRMLAPVLEQIESEANGSYEVVKVDVDESQELARRFGVMSIPTMIIFKNGKEMEKMVGLRQKNAIIESIKKYI
ncbi:MAG: thioredoxin [Clostridia bacterium]|nr:thioredoxin [Clostridia bacterium]